MKQWIIRLLIVCCGAVGPWPWQGVMVTVNILGEKKLAHDDFLYAAFYKPVSDLPRYTYRLVRHTDGTKQHTQALKHWETSTKWIPERLLILHQF